MAWFREPDFKERQKMAAAAKKAALEKFRANAGDPATAERAQSRATEATDRAAAKKVRDIEKAEKKARDAELALQAKREAAVEAERAATEKAEHELAKQAEQKAARDARYAARKGRSKKK